MLIVTVTITMCTTIIPAQAEDSRFPIELDYRCMDAIREMILDSCGHFQDLMMKERMEEHQKELEQNPSQLEHGRSKRHMDNLAENVNDVNFRVHYLTNESKYLNQPIFSMTKRSCDRPNYFDVNFFVVPLF